MEAFLRRVLPDGGNYIVSAIAGAAGAREVRGLTDIPSVARAAQRLSTAAVNVFVAVGTYGADRKEPRAKRCLFVDIDGKNFSTKPDMLKALATYCRAASFPPPTLYVDSGRGIHAYWTFDRDLPVEQWRPLAEALKASCLAAGFAIDPTPTADAARILRIPGTLNHKESPPIPCRVLKDTGADYDPATLLHALQPSTGLGAPPSALAKLAAMVGSDDLGSVPALSSYPQVPYYATEIAEKCGVMKEAVETGGRDHAEPLWRHLMALLAFCDDGEQLVHEISQGHPQYNANQTNIKWDQVLKAKQDGKLKPILCKTFAGYKNSICSQCPYNGRINTPMILGKLESTAYLPSNYRMGDYSVQKLVKKGDAETPDLWLDCFPYRITDVEVLDPGHKEPMAVRAVYSGKKDVRRMDFPHMLLSSSQNDGIGAEFAGARLWVTGAQITEFKTFMTSWLRKMSDVKAAVAVELHGLGWGKRAGREAFVAGPNVMTDDGKQHEFYYPDTQVLKNYIPVGDINSWQKCAQILAADPRQAVVTALLTAFAAPLVTFADVRGLTFSLFSAKSGTGKSSVIRTAQSVWGHPVRGIAQLDDTNLAVLNRLGFLNTIPAYWDELRGTNGDFGGFVKMLFTLGQGREKARLTSSIKQQSTGTWDTLITIASNERIVDHVDEHVKNSDAGRLRVFEVVMPEIVAEHPEFQRAEAQLDKNYGHAGQVYARYLVDHRQEAAELVRSITETLRKHAGTTGERFWTAFVAVTMAAAILVERAGLLKINRPALQDYLVRQLAVQRGGTQQEYKAPTESAVQSIFEFVGAHRQNMLLVETFNGTGVAKYGTILTPANQMPRDEILILKAVNDKKLRIKRDAWKFWVRSKLKNSPTTFEQELAKLGATRARRSLNAGIQAASNARVEVIEIDLTDPAFAVLVDQ